jgi:hypothetical protein
MIKIIEFTSLIILSWLLITNHLFYFLSLSRLRNISKSCFSRIQATSISTPTRSISMYCISICPTCWYYIRNIFQLISGSSRIFINSFFSWMWSFFLFLIGSFQINLSCSKCTASKFCRCFVTLSKSHGCLYRIRIFKSSFIIFILFVLEF